LSHLEPYGAAFEDAAADGTANTLSGWISGSKAGVKGITFSTFKESVAGGLNIFIATSLERSDGIIIIRASGKDEG
jgi:hypothetical protein